MENNFLKFSESIFQKTIQIKIKISKAVVLNHRAKTSNVHFKKISLT